MKKQNCLFAGDMNTYVESPRGTKKFLELINYCNKVIGLKSNESQLLFHTPTMNNWNLKILNAIPFILA